MDRAIHKLLTVNMGIQPGERILVFTDHVQEGRLDEKEMDRCRRLEKAAERVAELAREITETVFYKYDALPTNGYEPPEPVWTLAFGDEAIKVLRERNLMEKLLTKRLTGNEFQEVQEILSRYKGDMVDVVIAMSNFSTSHTRFRKLLTTIGGTRYASMPLFDPHMFEGPMDVDWYKIAKRSEAIARLLTRADRAILTTPAGTEITINLKGREGHADTGLLTKKGSFGNLPAGEVYIAPVEGESEGKLILEWSTVRKLSPPVILTIKQGRIGDMDGDKEFVKYLEDIFNKYPNASYLAELGIGTNDKASRPDNILEAEKILGTTHIAFGDNTTFGGHNSVSFHEDYIFFKPTLILEYGDGSTDVVIKDGILTRDFQEV